MKYFSTTLLLVMGTCAFAGFTIEAENLDLAMGQETTISLYTSTGLQANLLLIVEWSYQSILKDPIEYPPLGSLGQIIPYTEAGVTDSGYRISIAGTEILPTGKVADFTFVTMDVGDIIVSLYDMDNDERIGSLTLAESPEPTTLLLLSLGGILLRKQSVH